MYNTSRFICLKCMKENMSIVRLKGRRKKYHIKDLACVNCNEITKNIEIRDCDFYEEVIDKAIKIRNEYY